MTIKSLNAGKHVFCEKPPAFTADDVTEIKEAESKSGKKLMYGFNHRNHDSVIRMKEIVDSEFGKIIWMRGRYGKSVNEDYYDNWRAKAPPVVESLADWVFTCWTYFCIWQVISTG